MSIVVHERNSGDIGEHTSDQYIDAGRTLPGDSSHGKVYLVGAGPGDPELITLKGLRCLRAADVVIYDRLVSPLLLEEAPAQTRRVFVGKESGCHSMKQEEINALLITYAQQGCLVVRLKGGDPFVFGRGGEEALALASAGIPFEVVPGVSSAIAAPAYAGIPVTHRDCASSVTIVTGHEQRTHTSSTVNWEQLAKLEGTLVIMMGVETLGQIGQRLLAGGLSPDTPAAVIQQGTLSQQKVVTGNVENIAERTRVARITSPAVIVVGAVAALSDSLTWFGTTQISSQGTRIACGQGVPLLLPLPAGNAGTLFSRMSND